MGGSVVATHPARLLALGLLTLIGSASYASAGPSVWDYLPDNIEKHLEEDGYLAITVDVCQLADHVACDMICNNYSSQDGSKPVGFGDGREFGIYERGDYDGRKWHYHGYGVSIEMNCGQDG